MSKQVESGKCIKVKVEEIFDDVSSSLPEVEGWVELGIPSNPVSLVVGTRVGAETLDKAFKALSSQSSLLSLVDNTDLKHILGSVIRIQASVRLKGDDDVVGTSLLDDVRDYRDSVSLTTKFDNLIACSR